ncbi:MAG: helix-turn-helix domain-containing protein [Nanoarchaeota archaeon]|nr:helix-turn-helix domain-containing protein [Nanoarchaeota archaeon]
MIKESLKNIGLTDGEAKVYLALLKTGSSTVGPIVNEANVAYSNIYEILDRLSDKGLISHIIREKTKYFQAAPPNRLNEYLNKKEEEIQKDKEELKKLMPLLDGITNQKESQTAEIFSGLRGIKTAYYKMLEGGNKKEEWLFFYKDEGQATDDFYSDLYPVFKKIPSRGIANKEYKTSKFIKETKFKIKYVDFPFPGTIDLYGDRVLLISWVAQTGILISSRDMADKFREYFNSAWSRKTN